MAHARKKSTTINIRIDASQLALIDKATSAQSRDRTSFILDCVYREAINVLLDRRLFLLDENQFKAFEQILNAAPRDLPKLTALLKKKAPWENTDSEKAQKSTQSLQLGAILKKKTPKEHNHDENVQKSKGTTKK